MPKTRADRVRWTLEELGLAYQLENINLNAGEANTPEYKKIHPHGSLPAIEIDGNVMFESCAICHWLADQFPEKNLAPTLNSVARQQYEQWIFYMPTMMEPPIWENFLHTTLLPEEQRIADLIPWNISRYLKTIRVLNDALADNEYLVENKFSLADLLVGGSLINSKEHVENYPALLEYTQRLIDRDAYKKAMLI